MKLKIANTGLLLIFDHNLQTLTCFCVFVNYVIGNNLEFTVLNIILLFNTDCLCKYILFSFCKPNFYSFQQQNLQQCQWIGYTNSNILNIIIYLLICFKYKKTPRAKKTLLNNVQKVHHKNGGSFWIQKSKSKPFPGGWQIYTLIFLPVDWIRIY